MNLKTSNIKCIFNLIQEVNRINYRLVKKLIGILQIDPSKALHVNKKTKVKTN